MMSGEAGYWEFVARARLNRRRLAAAAVPWAAAFALGGCGQPRAGSRQQSPAAAGGAAGGPASGGRPGGTLALRIGTNPPTFDPHRTTAGPTENVVGATNSRLLQYKTGSDPKVAEDHDVLGDLALSVETPDATAWTVKLRPGARFHNIAPVNGHTVEAEDIKATFTRALDPKNPGRSALDMIDPQAIQTPAADTVVFRLNYTYAPFPGTLASSTYGWILPREALAGAYDPATQLIGSGPFIAGTMTPDVAYAFKKNPDWYGAPQPFIDGLQLSVVPDDNQALAQFTSGHLDTYGSTGIAIDNAQIPSIARDNPKAQIIKLDPSGAVLLFYHVDDPASPFADIRVRRALSMALDRDTLAKAIYNNDAERQFYVYLNLGKWAMRQQDLPAETAQYYAYDPAGSKKLMEAAGMTGREFKFIYVANYLGPVYERMSQAVANMLNQAGIKVTLSSVDYTKDFVGGGKGIRYGNYPSDTIVSAGIAVYEDVDTFLYNYYDSKATSGLSHLNDPQVDSMIAKARATIDENARLKAYLDTQKYLADKMYTVSGLPQGTIHIFVQPRVRNYQQSLASGAPTESFAKLWLAS
jgi:peptide/nickel transport system substrate-binding protein